METILIVGSFYFISIIIYNQIYLLKKYLIQPSIICGVLLLLLGPYGPSFLPESLFRNLKELPGILISFLFSGIMLSSPEFIIRNTRIFPRILRQGTFVWIIAILQLLVGFIISYFISKNNKDYLLLSSIIEIGWIGGHGSAAAFSGVVRQLHFSEAGDFAIISATIGLLWGSISGMILVNLLKRNRLFRIFKKDNINDNDLNEQTEINFEQQIQIQNLIYGFILPIIPVAISYYSIKILLTMNLFGKGIHRFIEELPLFFIVILYAFILKNVLLSNFKEKESIQIGIKFFTGIVLDILILSAIATMNLIIVFQSYDIIILYTIGGIVISILIFFISFIFVDDFPEISLINYGMATGTTAIGLLLLNSYRNINEKSSQIAILVYGSAAPLSAPFIGGGIISLLIPIFISKGYFFFILYILIFILILLISINLYMKKFIN
ncbi:MAG: sodium:solute symporter [Leptospiraceae bacterium]|nr:MAG: sodium:solute symporter [Leptospiraceae bacterium]